MFSINCKHKLHARDFIYVRQNYTSWGIHPPSHDSTPTRNVKITMYETHIEYNSFSFSHTFEINYIFSLSFFLFIYSKNLYIPSVPSIPNYDTCLLINLSIKNSLKDLTRAVDCCSSPFVGLRHFRIKNISGKILLSFLHTIFFLYIF